MDKLIHHSICLDCASLVSNKMASHISKGHVIFDTLIHPDPNTLTDIEENSMFTEYVPHLTKSQLCI